MIDIHLRADTEADLAAAVPFAHDDEHGWLTSGDGYALDLIGPLVTQQGTYDDDGNEISPPEVDARFHANLRCSENVAAIVPSSVVVTPDQPKRVWL